MSWFRKRHPGPPAASQPPFPQDGGAEYLAVAQGRLDHQMDALAALETKAQAVIAVVLSVGALLAAVAALRPEHSPVSCLVWVCLTVAVVAAVFSLVCAGLSLWVQDVATYPTPTNAWKLTKLGDFGFRAGLVLEDAWAGNRKLLDRRATLVRLSLAGVTLCAVAVFATAAVLLTA